MRALSPRDIWLACRKKLMNNMKIQSARKATHTWLARGKSSAGTADISYEYLQSLRQAIPPLYEMSG